MAAPRRAVEPADITRIRWVTDAQLSPDGARVAFVVTTLSEARDEYLSNVWIADVTSATTEPRRPADARVRAETDREDRPHADGQLRPRANREIRPRANREIRPRANREIRPRANREIRPFTTGPKRDTAPRWSPDGKRLAFLSERDGAKKPQLYVMPSTGGEATRLTDLPNGVGDPVWSPDSTRLAFVARVGGWQEPEDEEERRKSKPPRVITTLKYKLNAEGFVHDRHAHVFVVPADGGPPVQLTNGDAHDSDPAWSPDGDRIAFASARHDERDRDDAADIWLIPAKGGEPRRLTETKGPAALPVFSPNGDAVLYLGREGRNFLGGHMRLFLVPVAGGRSRCLTAELDRCVSSATRPFWLDHDAIAFLIEDRGDVALWRTSCAAHSKPHALLAGERWITSVSRSSDGARLAFTATDAVSPAEVFVSSGDGADEQPLADLNAEWKAETAPVAPERFRFERAGFEIDAWIMRPFGFEAGRRYPALLNVHGGPHAQYGHQFFDEFQVYAGAGYVVLFANPRGSQGGSEAFARAVVGDWGGGDFDDVMATLDEALRRFDFIDPDRVGLIGGSYGGFMTSWAVGHTGRFRAACSERAVNNLPTMFGTSDIGHWFQVVETGGALPWDDAVRWIERSPLSYATRIRTPLLIMHSEDDLRCPISEAEQLFVALRTLGRETVFVRFPDENHELSRSGKPRHRLERFRIILDWFARHLGEAPVVTSNALGRT